MNLDRPVMLWRCPECGSVRSVIGDCHHHTDEPVKTEAVWYSPVEESEGA